VVAGAARKSVWLSLLPWKYSNGTGKVAPSQEGLLNPPTGSQSNSPASSGDYSALSSCESVPGSTLDESNCSSTNLDFLGLGLWEGEGKGKGLVLDLSGWWGEAD
jgi:hypothetical protein